MKTYQILSTIDTSKGAFLSLKQRILNLDKTQTKETHDNIRTEDTL